jgi:hypothetical protein
VASFSKNAEDEVESRNKVLPETAARYLERRNHSEFLNQENASGGAPGSGFSPL